MHVRPDPRDDPNAAEFLPLGERPAIEQARWWALKRKAQERKVRAVMHRHEESRENTGALPQTWGDPK